MITTAFGLALASLVVVLGAVIQYFSTIPRGKVPAKPIGLVIFLTIGAALAVIAIAKSFSGGALSVVAVILPSALALLMALGIFWLLSQRKTPVGDLKVKPGDKLLTFEATTSDGTPFHTDELAGKRTLLKFFRGGWCPYCSAKKFGIPLAAPTGFSAMAIPTSLLIDENGVIQWIDQSEDYRLRSSNSLVLEAVKNAFG